MRLVVLFTGITLLIVAAVAVPCPFPPTPLYASEVPQPSGFTLLNPIRSGNLTVFPVVTSKSYDTSEFITLDEGLRSGDVVVTEAGEFAALSGVARKDPMLFIPSGAPRSTA